MSTFRNAFNDSTITPLAARASARLSRGAACLILSAASLMVMPAFVSAQLQTLPTEIVSSQGGLSSEQKAQIEKFVSDHVKALSGEAKAMREARVTLLSPLTSVQIGLPFRSEYSESLLKSLPEIARGGGPKGVNAILILGEVATTKSLDVIESLLDASEPAVRFASASAINASFEQVRAKSPSLAAERVKSSLAKLAARLGAEQDALVFDSLVRASLAAGRINQSGYEQLRGIAADALSKALAERLAAGTVGAKDAAMLQATLRAALAFRDELAIEERNRGVAGNAARLAAGVLKNVTSFAGEALALSARMIKDAEINPAADADDAARERATKGRAVIGQLAGTAQSMVYLAGPLMENGPLTPSNVNLGAVAREAKNESDARFLTTVTELVGPGGVLSKAPFSISRTFKLP